MGTAVNREYASSNLATRAMKESVLHFIFVDPLNHSRRAIELHCPMTLEKCEHCKFRFKCLTGEDVRIVAEEKIPEDWYFPYPNDEQVERYIFGDKIFRFRTEMSDGVHILKNDTSCGHSKGSRCGH